MSLLSCSGVIDMNSAHYRSPSPRPGASAAARSAALAPTYRSSIERFVHPVDVSHRRRNALRGPEASLTQQSDKRIIALIAEAGALARFDEVAQLVVCQRLHHFGRQLGGLETHQRVFGKFILLDEPPGERTQRRLPQPYRVGLLTGSGELGHITLYLGAGKVRRMPALLTPPEIEADPSQACSLDNWPSCRRFTDRGKHC